MRTSSLLLLRPVLLMIVGTSFKMYCAVYLLLWFRRILKEAKQVPHTWCLQHSLLHYCCHTILAAVLTGMNQVFLLLVLFTSPVMFLSNLVKKLSWPVYAIVSDAVYPIRIARNIWLWFVNLQFLDVKKIDTRGIFI